MATSEVSHATYATGSVIPLQLEDGSYANAKIIKRVSFTMSCVLLVEVDSLSLPSECILKLFDRRFAEHLRECEDASEWTTTLERGYRLFRNSEKAKGLFKHWYAEFREDPWWYDSDQESWPAVQLEAFLQFHCERFYESETHAYHLLKDLQGKSVPKLLSTVTAKSSPNSLLTIDCPGILIQHIDGYNLEILDKRAPCGQWQHIGGEAIKLIHEIGDHGICNRDVRLRSIIVTEEPTHIWMIDFGLCVFDHQAKSLEEFKRWQADEDEEGCIGAALEIRLKEGFKWHISDRALKLLYLKDS